MHIISAKIHLTREEFNIRKIGSKRKIKIMGTTLYLKSINYPALCDRECAGIDCVTIEVVS